MAAARSRRVVRHAGSTPNNTTDISTTAAVNTHTRRSIAAANGAGPLLEAVAVRMRKIRRPAREQQRRAARHHARAGRFPSAAGASSRARPAPSDIRTASSRWRPAARASSRFATLAQAISITSPAIATRTNNGASNCRRNVENPVPNGSNVMRASVLGECVRTPAVERRRGRGSPVRRCPGRSRRATRSAPATAIGHSGSRHPCCSSAST